MALAGDRLYLSKTDSFAHQDFARGCKEGNNIYLNVQLIIVGFYYRALDCP